MCVFCKIIDGTIPSTVVYEDEIVKCILDLSQAGVGHTLVIPKKHYDNVLEIDPDTFAYAMKIAKKIAEAQVKAFAEEGHVAIRNIRRDSLEDIKKLELPEDEEKHMDKEIQDLVSEYNKKIDDILKLKEEELLTV